MREEVNGMRMLSYCCDARTGKEDGEREGENGKDGSDGIDVVIAWLRDISLMCSEFLRLFQVYCISSYGFYNYNCFELESLLLLLKFVDNIQDASDVKPNNSSEQSGKS